MTRQTIVTAIISLSLMLVGPSSSLSCFPDDANKEKVAIELAAKKQARLERLERLALERLEKVQEMEQLLPEERAKVEARRQKDEEAYHHNQQIFEEAKKKAEADPRLWHVVVGKICKRLSTIKVCPSLDSEGLRQRLENKLQQELKNGSSIGILKEQIENGQWLSETERQQVRATVILDNTYETLC